MSRNVRIVAGASALVAAAVISMLFMSREPEFDPFPAPPSPSLASDGTRVFTIEPGTSVQFPRGSIAGGDSIACTGKGSAAVPPPGTPDITVGAIIVDASANGDVIASCAPHPLAKM